MAKFVLTGIAKLLHRFGEIHHEEKKFKFLFIISLTVFYRPENHSFVTFLAVSLTEFRHLIIGIFFLFFFLRFACEKNIYTVHTLVKL